MSYQRVQNILDARLATVDDIPIIVQENEFADKTSSLMVSANTKPYVRTTLIPSEVEHFTLGATGSDRLNGLYQASIFYTQGDEVDFGNIIADRIVEKFRGRGVSTSLITDGTITVRIWRSWRDIGIQSTTKYMLPVTIRWTSEKS